MVVKFNAEDVEIKPITRAQRRELHHLNKQVYHKSEFRLVKDKPEIINLVTDYILLEILTERALMLAFDDPKVLDKKYSDVEQDALAQLIVVDYLGLSKKKA